MPPARAQARGRGRPVTLNFVNAEIDAVARTMATSPGATWWWIRASRAPSRSPARSRCRPRRRWRSSGALRAGLHGGRENGLAQVVPEAEAKLQAGSVSAGAVRGGGQVRRRSSA
jgi:general secretion pathway protein D